MADQFDKASDTEQKFLDDSLARQQQAAQQAPKLQPAGHCLNPRCGDDLKDPAQLFCGPDCAGEYQRLTKLKRN
jgi:hypothetical protein